MDRQWTGGYVAMLLTGEADERLHGADLLLPILPPSRDVLVDCGE